MFRADVQGAKMIIDDALRQVTNIELIIKGLSGDKSAEFVNSLFTLVLDPTTPSLQHAKVVHDLVSQYAARCLAETYGLAWLKAMWKNPSTERNPALKGWIFQLIVEESAKKQKRLQLLEHTTTESTSIFLAVNNVHSWAGKLEDGLDTMGTMESNDLLIPERFNQGGYDLLSLEETKPAGPAAGDKSEWTVRAIQVTISKEHDVKATYMAEAVRDLRAKRDMIITALEVWVIVLGGTQASSSTGKSTGVAFKSNWEDDILSNTLRTERGFSYPNDVRLFSFDPALVLKPEP